MSFQNTLNTYPAKGAPGLRAGLNPVVFLLPVPVAASGGVTVGNAVFSGSAAGTVASSGSAGAKAVGIVLRELVGQITATAEANNTIPAGWAVPVAVRGDLYVVSAGAVTAGQKVFANLTTGALTGAAAAATVSGAVETGWVIQQAAAAGEPFLISNW